MSDYEQNSVGGRRQPAAAVLLTLLAFGGVLLSAAIFLKLMDVAGCGVRPESRCDYTLIGVAQWLTPITLGISFVASAGVLIAARRSSRNLWWVPALGCLLTISAALASFAMLASAIPLSD